MKHDWMYESEPRCCEVCLDPILPDEVYYIVDGGKCVHAECLSEYIGENVSTEELASLLGYGKKVD